VSGSGISWVICVSTSLQTDNHASTPPLSFLQAGCPSCHPTNSVKALKAIKALKAKHGWEAGYCNCQPFPLPLLQCPGAVSDLAVNTRSRTSWTTDAGSTLVQHVPSLKFMWSLQYMLSRICESHCSAAALTCRPSDMDDRKPDASRRDDDQMWTELRSLAQNKGTKHFLSCASFVILDRN